MTTRLEITKGGVKLISEVSKHPRPKPRQAWPVPDFPAATESSLLHLVLESATSTGRTGIRVTSLGASLPDLLADSDPDVAAAAARIAQDLTLVMFVLYSRMKDRIENPPAPEVLP